MVDVTAYCSDMIHFFMVFMHGTDSTAEEIFILHNTTQHNELRGNRYNKHSTTVILKYNSLILDDLLHFV